MLNDKVLADATHNLIDGMLIGAAYSASITGGVATSVAIVLHEVPQELGDFGVLLHAGFTRTRALILNFLSGLVAILGALLSLWVSQSATNISEFMLPFTAGSFIYIAGSDLLPELHKEHRPSKSLVQLLALLGGISLMYLLLLIR